MSESIKIWIGIWAFACCLSLSFDLHAQPCPIANPIQGLNEVCPGSQTQYTMSVDNRPTSTFLWELFGVGGTIAGATNGVTIAIDWEDENGGPYLLRCTEQIGMCYFQNEMMITVADDLARGRFNCFSEISIPFDENCEKLVLPDHLLSSGAPSCDNSFVVELYTAGGVAVPNPVGIQFLGEIITGRVIHVRSGAACESKILFKDGTRPTISCTNDTTLCSDPNAWTPFDTSFNTPVAIDNCADTVEVQPEGYEWVQLLEDPIFDAYIIRSWSAVDKYANRATCDDTIFLRKVIFDEIVCPPDTTIRCDSLGIDPSDPLTYGVPTFDGMPLWTDRSYCDFGIKYHDLVSYECAGTYTIHRYWYYSQVTAAEILEDTCHQIIYVVDTVGPVAQFDSTKIVWEAHSDVFGLPTDTLYKTIYYPTLDYECLASGYFPAPLIFDNCTNVDSVVVDILWDNGHINYLNGSPESEHLRFTNLARGKHLVTVKLRDACHNTSYDTLVIIAEDSRPPYIVLDKFPVVTLGEYSDVTWIDVSVFDEGTWDNCDLSLLMARRVDWKTACGMDLCDQVEPYCDTEHLDSLYCAVLGDSTYSSGVEAHYAENLRWLCEDNAAYNNLIIGGWWYDLLKSGTMDCKEHPYDYSEEDFLKVLRDPSLQCRYNEISVGDLCTKFGFDYDYDPDLHPESEFNSFETLDLDLLSQIGGGWSTEVPFCCEDACEGNKVTIEVIAIDHSGNVARQWVDVEVEDKTAPTVQKVLPDLNISCWAYNNYYRDSIAAGNYEVFGVYELYQKDIYAGEPGYTIIRDRECLLEDESPEYYRFYEDTIANGLILENCILQISETQKVHFERCGEGWIERKFVFKGACNSIKADSTVITQKIYIYNDCPLQEREILWPVADTSVYGCHYVDIETEGPKLKHEDECREIGINYSDRIIDVLYNADSTCLKVVRTWAIIDWCRQTAPYHEDWMFSQNHHYYEFEQIIYFKNLEGPEIAGCEFDSVCIGQNCVGTLDRTIQVTDDCTPSDQIDVSWTVYKGGDYGYQPIAAADTNHAWVQGLEIGEYKIVWKAVDECHNETICANEFVVKDCVKPSPVCVTSSTIRLIPIDLDENGSVDTAVAEIWADELNASSYDNCQDELDFRLRIKGTGKLDQSGQLMMPDSAETFLKFSCEDIGTVSVELWVVDQSGNADFCEVLIIVQAPIEGCSGQLGRVRGTVSSIKGAGIEEVTMMIEDANKNERVAISDSKGQYDFKNWLMNQSTYQLRPSKIDRPIDGISTLDIIKISKHISYKELLENDMEEVAADANQDGRVSVLDMITLRKLLLGKIDELPIDQQWKFYNKNRVGTSELSLAFNYLELLTFTGVKVGDVNGDISNYNPSARSTGNPVLLSYVDRSFNEGEEFDVEFLVSEELTLEGLQLAFKVNEDVLELLSASSDPMKMERENWSVHSGELRVSVSDEDPLVLEEGGVLRIRMKAKNSGKLSNSVALSGNSISSEVYTYAGNTESVNLNAIDPYGLEIDLSQNFPNPFERATTFVLKVSESVKAYSTIYDMTGKRYQIYEHQFSAGRNEIVVNRQDLGNPGIYVYELVIGDERILKKMILTD